MTGKLLLAALLAGMLAGLVYAGLAYIRLGPMLAQAETYERAALDPTHFSPDHDEITAPHDHATADDGHHDNRTLLTVVTTVSLGAGFAALLLGISLLSGLALTRRNGAIWGLCGFIAIALAPSAGLPPELPGMPEADLGARQIWWVGTVLASAIALLLMATRHKPWSYLAAIFLLALPQFIGAPQAVDTPQLLPASLAANFTANSLVLSAIFWVLLGSFTGFALSLFHPERHKAS